jgi:lipopolysaccharide export system permease protein
MRMKILDRYVASVVLRHFAIALAALLAIFSIISLTEELRLAGTPGYGVWQALRFVALTLPAEAYALFPASALLGTVTGLGELLRHNELVALQAAGVSRARVSLSVMAVAALLAATGVGLGEVIGAPLSQQARTRRALALSGGQTLNTASGLWIRDGSRFINIGELGPDGSLGEVYVFDLDQRALRRFTYARTVARRGDQWTLEDMRESVFHPDDTNTVRRAAAQPWDTPIAIEPLRTLCLEPEDLSIAELRRTIGWLGERGQSSLRYELALWRRLGAPVYTGLMVLLALPLVLVAGLGRRAGELIVLGAVIGIGFQMFQQTFSNFGVVAGLPPLVTAAVPGAVALVAIAVLFRLRELR